MHFNGKKKLLIKLLFYTIFSYKYLVRRNKKVKRLLILRTDALGDFILFSALLPYIKRKYKEYEITMVVNPIASDLVKLFPYINNTILYDAKANRLKDHINFINKIIERKFEIVFYAQVNSNPWGELIVNLSKAQERIGVYHRSYSVRKREKLSKLFNNLIDIPTEIISQVEINSYILRKLGIIVNEVLIPKITVAKNEIIETAEAAYINNLDKRKFCIIFPGAGQSYRVWPAPNYIAVIKYLIKKDITPLVCGSNNDKKFASAIVQALSNKEVINLVGQTDLLLLAWLLTKSLFYLGSETGILHLAIAVNTPVICLIGGGHFGRFFPYGNEKRNRIVYDENMSCMRDNWNCARNLPHGEPAPCIKGIRLENVLNEIDSLLNFLNIKNSISYSHNLSNDLHIK
jgi:ADP-heptose:LPS heptosyltransferase